MPKTNWKPTQKTWGQLAHRETVQAFGEKVDSRALALCTWCLAQEPDMPLEELENVAKADVDIPRTTDGKKISAHTQQQARRLLGLPAGTKKRAAPRKAKKESKLSPIEKAILAQYQASMDVVTDYARATAALAEASAAFDRARAALCAIPREQAQTLAEADPAAAEILAGEGVLPDAGPARPPTQQHTSTHTSTHDAWPAESHDRATAEHRPSLTS